MMVGVIGSRTEELDFDVLSRVVRGFAGRGWSVATGGALGVDSAVLSVLVGRGLAESGVVYSPWSSWGGFPAAVRPLICRFLSRGGRVIWGSCPSEASRREVTAGLFSRNSALVRACRVLVVFGSERSAGSVFCIKEAVRSGCRVVCFPPPGGELPFVPGYFWRGISWGRLAGGFWLHKEKGLLVKCK